MRIFTYGIEDIKMDAVRWRFGKADYIDVTPQYQDILALCADIVLVLVLGSGQGADLLMTDLLVF